MKNWVVAVAGVLATMTAVAVAAPAAQAGIDTPRVLLGNVGGRCALSNGADQITITGNPGDSFRVANLGCGPVTAPRTGDISGPGSIADYTSAVFTLGSSIGTGTVVINPDRTKTTVPFVIRVNIVSTPIVTPVEPAHDYLQQVGVPATGSCADVPHDAGHLTGFPYGGWSKSWAQWINGGRGGAVCTREIYYDYGLESWRYIGQA